MDYSGGVAGRPGHLDPSTGREVVFCHSCSNEWYNNEDGLQCPRCHSDICEIVSTASTYGRCPAHNLNG